MGIKNLYNFIRKKSPKAIRSVLIEEYKHKKIAIDGSMFLHQFKYAKQHEETPNAFLYGILEQVAYLVQKDIMPVYIFDGKPPSQKHHELKKRKERRDKLQKKLDDLNSIIQSIRDEHTAAIENPKTSTADNKKQGGDTVAPVADVNSIQITEDPMGSDNVEVASVSSEVSVEDTSVSSYSAATDNVHIETMLSRRDKLQRQTIRVTPDDVAKAIEVLKILDIPVFIADREGEEFCSLLNLCDLVDAVATEDMDALPFHAYTMIRGLGKTSRDNLIDEISLNHVLDSLGFTYSEFVDFCILCGSDFTCDSIRNIGPERAFKHIDKYKIIENVLYNLDHSKYHVPHSFDYKAARQIFTRNMYLVSNNETLTETLKKKLNLERKIEIIKETWAKNCFTMSKTIADRFKLEESRVMKNLLKVNTQKKDQPFRFLRTISAPISDENTHYRSPVSGATSTYFRRFESFSDTNREISTDDI